MHLSSYNIVLKFHNLVVKHFQNEKIKLLDVGSYGVNGTYRDIFSDTNKFVYVGPDLQPGPNVDYIPQDPAKPLLTIPLHRTKSSTPLKKMDSRQNHYWKSAAPERPRRKNNENNA